MLDSKNHALLSRRRLLGRAAGVAAAGLAPGLRGVFDPVWGVAGAGPYGPFKMSFQSYSLRHFTAIGEFVREARRLGLGYVELWRGHLDPDKPVTNVKGGTAFLRDAGLRVAAFGVEDFTADHDRNERLFRFGKFLGVENLSANPSKDSFGSLEKLVSAYNIKIAIHNHGPEDQLWRKPEWVLEAVKNLDPRIGSCADLGHFMRAGIDPIAALELLGRRVLGCHFKDFDKQGRDVVVGTGQLDVTRTLKTLKKIGFSGPLSLEFEGDKEDPVPKMLRCLDTIRSAVKQI